jgi:pentatricopeptide repeat protein
MHSRFVQRKACWWCYQITKWSAILWMYAWYHYQYHRVECPVLHWAVEWCWGILGRDGVEELSPRSSGIQYNNHFFVSQRTGNRAIKVFDRMSEHGSIPDIVTYNYIVDCLFNKMCVDDALKLLDSGILGASLIWLHIKLYWRTCVVSTGGKMLSSSWLRWSTRPQQFSSRWSDTWYNTNFHMSERIALASNWVSETNTRERLHSKLNCV